MKDTIPSHGPSGTFDTEPGSATRIAPEGSERELPCLSPADRCNCPRQHTYLAYKETRQERTALLASEFWYERTPEMVKARMVREMLRREPRQLLRFRKHLGLVDVNTGPTMKEKT